MEILITALLGKNWKLFLKEKMNKRHASDWEITRLVAGCDPIAISILSEAIAKRSETLESDAISYIIETSSKEVGESKEFIKEEQKRREYAMLEMD